MSQAAVGVPIELRGRRLGQMDDMTEPGDYSFSPPDGTGALWYMCPCGCGQLQRIPLSPIEVFQYGPQQQERPSIPGTWGFDGNLDAPRLIPSIRRTGGCKWHGHLTGGVWKGTRE